VRKALQRAGWKLTDVERIEINEAFAAVPLAVAKELGLPEDIINVEGGAIAHGHPIGATGAVLTTRLIHSMRRDGLKRGIVTLCIGGGQGIALAIETLRVIPFPPMSFRGAPKARARNPEHLDLSAFRVRRPATTAESFQGPATLRPVPLPARSTRVRLRRCAGCRSRRTERFSAQGKCARRE
jgi:hypothetical protein